jgi:plasmid stability protein
MGQLTVRKLDDEIIRRLKIRAAEHGRSAEAEHREILKQALSDDRPRMSREEWFRRADELRKRMAPMPDESWNIIREFRDKR